MYNMLVVGHNNIFTFDIDRAVFPISNALPST